MMVLSHLETKDLTHALSVSKNWHQTILDTIELRRNLFLAPKEKANEFLQWKRIDLEWKPFIVHEFITGSKLIVKVHPALLPDRVLRTCLDTIQSNASLQLVSPSTLLTQPPVTEFTIVQQVFSPAFGPEHKHKFVLKRERGVTFGDVVEEMRARQAREPAGESVAAEESLGDGSLVTVKVPLDQRNIRIEASGVVAEASELVRVAREGLEQ